MAIFSSARLKLQRASQLINELETMLTEHIAKGPVGGELTGQMEADDGGPPWVTSKIILPLPPENASVLIGDIVHNMRTSLDHMASEMTRLNNQPDKNVYFPFSEDSSQFDKLIKDRKFHRCGAEAVALVRTLKPYRLGNVALRAIHDLDILDKHRALVPQAEAWFESVKTTEWVGPAFRNENGLGRQFKYVPPAPSKVHYVFPKDSEFSRRPVIETLKSLMELCESILEAFAALKSIDEAHRNSVGNGAGEPETHQILYARERLIPGKRGNQ